MKCWINQCSRFGRTKGLCNSHYMRLWRYGDPERQLKFIQHSLSKTPEYRIWCNMKERCYSPTNNRFHTYGGRGIRICGRWINDFETFYKDMGPRPSPKHSIERIHNDGNYEPSNCKWATRLEQANNTSTNRHLAHNGETHTLAEWSRITGMKVPMIWQRLRRGWPVSEALTPQPSRRHYQRAQSRIAA